ncbi:hypothetical protein HEP85_19910 [Streptomyces sp. RPA4-2]|uniref:hypothetical protein n=1 Tax=Streptomyces sp. RPA4-2 TaxID=2721244 RepID=UPI00143EB6D9|nr:hypothetical protein [Streptomyces sp. RPA4-2]QIY63475.1 hypothetical protein HEP85_19910 [Streptomyces sp. RPA4-2]
MSIAIAMLCGMVASLITIILHQHLGAGRLETTGYAGASFLGVASFVKMVAEKLGVL